MKFLALVLLLVSAHFSLTAFAPAPKAWIVWPFGNDSKPILKSIGGLPKQGGSFVTPLLAGVAGICFLTAALALFGFIVPASWFSALVLVGAIASILLQVLYINIYAILPIIVDIVLLLGIFVARWLP